MADTPPVVPRFTPAEKPQGSPSDCLESWKEIATHLNRTVRTVQRWEKSEGLPVHRHQHEERAHVYAFKSEIDAWWKTRRIQLEGQDRGEEAGRASRGQLEEGASAGGAAYVLTRRTAVAAAATLILFAFLAFQNWKWRRRAVQETAVAAGQVTVAVLPFKNASGNRELDYFRIALPDQIATILSYSSTLAVRPFAETEKYAGADFNPQAAGRELKVANIVTGHFLRERDRLQVTLEAVDIGRNQLLWTDTLNAAIDDEIDLNKEISLRIQHGLLPHLDSTGVAVHSVDSPHNPEAYDLYLRSLAVSPQQTSSKQAIPLLERAVALDPGYAPAWQQLGQRYYISGHSGGGGIAELERAQAASQRALALTPDFPDAARILTVSRTERGDLEGAYDAARDFLRLRPSDAQAHWSMGYVLRYAGLAKESVREYETALRLDPTNYILRDAALSSMQTGDYARALEFLRLDEGSSWSEGVRAKILLQQKKYQQAGDAFRHSSETGAGTVLAWLDHHSLGDLDREAAKSEIVVLAMPDPEDRYWQAADFAACGLKSRALKMLQLAVEGNYLGYPAMDYDPLFANIRGVPEFAAIRALAIQKQRQFVAYRSQRDRTAR